MHGSYWERQRMKGGNEWLQLIENIINSSDVSNVYDKMHIPSQDTVNDIYVHYHNKINVSFIVHTHSNRSKSADRIELASIIRNWNAKNSWNGSTQPKTIANHYTCAHCAPNNRQNVLEIWSKYDYDVRTWIFRTRFIFLFAQCSNGYGRRFTSYTDVSNLASSTILNTMVWKGSQSDQWENGVLSVSD